MKLYEITSAVVKQIIYGIDTFNKDGGKWRAFYPKEVTIETDVDGIKTKFTIPIDIDYMKDSK